MADGVSKLPPLVVIAGPTASGKSALAVTLAQKFHGEVLNCDAMQVYRGFDIGTAKLTLSEQAGIPHHFLDCRQPEETFSAGEFSRLARQLLPEITQRKKLPIVAGGTGFYIRALLQGLFEGPTRNPDLRLHLQKRETARAGILHRFLRRLDSAAAGKIHANDVQKIIRALEVCLQERRLSDLHEERIPEPLHGYRQIKIFLDPPREQVYERINQRCVEMFRNGLMDEVRSLLEQGVSPGTQPFLAVGYREALAALHSEITIDRAVELTQIASRQYAKRQWTWFRREQNFHFLPGFGTDPEIIYQASQLLD